MVISWILKQIEPFILGDKKEYFDRLAKLSTANKIERYFNMLESRKTDWLLWTFRKVVVDNNNNNNNAIQTVVEKISINLKSFSWQ